MPRRPELSIVVATRNRSDRIARLLQSFTVQENAPPFEVIVVDDASEDDTWAVLSGWRVVSSFPCRVIRLHTRYGPGLARNAGWRVAASPVVVFTDDDCVPDAGWLRAIGEGIDGVDVVQGPTYADPEQLPRAGPWTDVMHRPSGTPFFETCNVAYRRELLEKVGGFDPEFRYAGEDVDLAQRVMAAGAVSRFEPKAVVVHDVRRWTMRDRLNHVGERLDDAARVMARHPQLRPYLYHRLWYRPAHEPATLLAVGLPLVGLGRGHRWVAMTGLAAAAPYIAFRFREGRLDTPRTTNAFLIPLAWLVDMYEVALLTRGSWRHRTLML